SVFVGKRLVAALVEAGHDVAVLNRGRTPTTHPPGVRHLVADRTDVETMRAAVGSSQWDAVFDVSGFVMAAGGSDIDDLVDLFNDRVASYVYVSSIMAYDQSLVGVFPWTEDLPSNTDGPTSYGGFKAISERAMLRRHAIDEFPVVIVRPAAIYGPDNNIYDMETPMFLRLLQERPILLPHGGLVVGSYGHVDDLVAFMMTAAATPSTQGEIFNVTTGAVSTRRYVTTLAEIVGVAPKIVDLPDDVLQSLTVPVFGHLFGTRHHAELSTAKADAVLLPQHGFRAGHEATYEWFLSQGWADRSAEPLVDPVWRATWDFEAEADVARMIGARL
ncbi:MAG: NAD-dependent epimerase/dehydratase family protein, partial [Ilumatobacteraceae bacterium]